MSFMKPQVIEALFLTVESADGDWVIEADALGLTVEESVELTDEMRVRIAETCPESIGCVLEGDIMAAHVEKLWGGRLTAPGYMDRTEWTTGSQTEVVREMGAMWDWFWCKTCESWVEFPSDGIEANNHELNSITNQVDVCRA